MKGKTVAIVGAAETTELGEIPNTSQLELHCDAALNARSFMVNEPPRPPSQMDWGVSRPPAYDAIVAKALAKDPDQRFPTADAFMSYGDYAKAATLYRAALGKTGVDADLANLRLGIALARSGDAAGATSALNAVKGTRAGIAQMWLLYLQRQS